MFSPLLIVEINRRASGKTKGSQEAPGQKEGKDARSFLDFGTSLRRKP
jgi:hypothetical protein